MPFVLILFLIIFLIVASSIKILKEYERGVVFTLGRFWRVKGPGLVIVIPQIQQIVRVSLRTLVLDVPAQDLITSDNISVRVNAVVYYHVFDPKLSIIQVADFHEATSQLAQTTLRSALGAHELDQILSNREGLNTQIREILDEQTDAWGIKVTAVEIKDIELDKSMVNALAEQAKAERERRAKVIIAEGEQQASTKLVEAAKVLDQSPTSLMIRYLQTINQVSQNEGNTILIPLSDAVTSAFAHLTEAHKGANSELPVKKVKHSPKDSKDN